MTQESISVRWAIPFAAIALTFLVCAVFFPIAGFEFVNLDVDEQLIQNPYVHGLSWENVTHIFTARCITSYYPVRTLSFAIDYELWGLNPRGFKLTNGVIHLANSLLVFWLILRLFRHPAAGEKSCGVWWDVSAATLSAGVFAMHPVIVEPVTWVLGREELLMTLGTLGCLHLHLTARRLGGNGGRPRAALVCHGGAALFCAVACMSNAVAAVIPLLVVAWDVLTLSGAKWKRILGGTAALWVIGVATIAIKALGETISVPGTAALLSAERPMWIMKVYWLNLKTLVWPTQLAAMYSVPVPESLLDGEVILGGIAISLTGAVLWKLRRRKLVLWGLIWFGIALGPVSQIMPHHWARADRFLYLPLVGLVVALAMAMQRLRTAWKRHAVLLAVIAVGAAGLLLGTLSARQVRTWRNSLSMWQNCVEVDPGNTMAHTGLAETLSSSGQFDRAVQHYQMALQINPDNFVALNSFASDLAAYDQGKLQHYELAIQLAKRGCRITKWEDPTLNHTLAHAYSSFASALNRRGEFGRAMENYTKAIQAFPGCEVPLFNLALMLTECSDEKLRDPDRAVQLAERACGLLQCPGPRTLGILATAYAGAGRLDKAVDAVQQAIELARVEGDAQLVGALRRQLKRYGDGAATRKMR